jgi:hypothetical protein
MRFVCGDVRDLIALHKTDHGPYASALQSLATAEASKNLRSRDFRHRLIFDFCNNILSEADIRVGLQHICFVPLGDSCTAANGITIRSPRRRKIAKSPLVI